MDTVAELPVEVESLSSRLSDALASCHAIALAYLFGSAATGQTTPFSDVDIALVLEDGAALPSRLHFELGIEDQLAARYGLSRADVRVINDAPLVLRGEVVTEGILLYARADETRIEFETRTRDEYFDFLPVIESLREAFFADLRERGLSGQHTKSGRRADLRRPPEPPRRLRRIR